MVGGAGLVSGFLSFPAAIAMGSAILMRFGWIFGGVGSVGWGFL